METLHRRLKEGALEGDGQPPGAVDSELGRIVALKLLA